MVDILRGSNIRTSFRGTLYSSAVKSVAITGIDTSFRAKDGLHHPSARAQRRAMSGAVPDSRDPLEAIPLVQYIGTTGFCQQPFCPISQCRREQLSRRFSSAGTLLAVAEPLVCRAKYRTDLGEQLVVQTRPQCDAKERKKGLLVTRPPSGDERFALSGSCGRGSSTA